ncbi:MAG TPA: aminotransferase class V-fold PLP-dependent enzyme [Verrucomicrobiota bacterium]|nr:aminotransferase class V-fold PLP-dependent enzyme [Verrucomicrobiota bacterium]HQB15634.1 aminotransferase class V-fold PLP-dependent enzyme [Verrucomicrobiota bacterium]
MSAKYRFQIYKGLHQNLAAIYRDAKKFADEIGIPPEMKGQLGLTGAVSSCHALLTTEVGQAIEAASRKVVENKFLIEEIREIVKDVYGDGYDAAPTNTCEAALWVSFDTLASPPTTGRGENYRARYLAPFERHLHHHGGYGRPFPPRYKDLFADRGVTAGELGFSGKRLDHTDAVFVPLEGARYELHGIKQHPAVLLANVDAKKSLARLEKTAARHAANLTAFTSLGYDSAGYGYGDQDAKGVPTLQTGIAKLARDYGVPYIVDNAWGTPFIGTDPRRIGADVMAYSMDKSSGAPTVGLIIGREEVMVPIRRALGYHSDRFGTGYSYGKAAYVTNDPGKEALVGLIAALKILRDRPAMMTKPLDQLLAIVKDECRALPKRFHPDLRISKSRNSLAVEINYENTWKPNRPGIPIFSIEDMYGGTNIFQAGMAQMGIIPTIAYDGNIFISLGLGTLDADGNLLEKETRLIVKAMVGLMNITCKYAGVA